jgi:hypothetical protein
MKGFDKTWQQILNDAEDQEATTQALLVGQLTLKAAADPHFRQELQSKPKSVIQREAESLSIEPNERVVDAVGRAFSAAIPGADTDKVQKLIFDTVDDMRRSFKLTLELSRWLFFAGLGMVALAFGAALLSDKLWAVGVSGGSGVLSLLLSAVMNPLDRIRAAAANLAQVQASYLAFYKQLYILGTSTETLTRADAVSFSEELRKAATAMVDSVGTALEKGGGDHDRKRGLSRGGVSPRARNGGKGRPAQQKPGEQGASAATTAEPPAV